MDDKLILLVCISKSIPTLHTFMKTPITFKYVNKVLKREKVFLQNGWFKVRLTKITTPIIGESC